MKTEPKIREGKTSVLFNIKKKNITQQMHHF